MIKPVIAAVISLTAALPLAGASASEMCDGLQAELASLSETYSAPQLVRKYARAIAEQKMNIRALRVQLRDINCSGGSIVVIGNAAGGECATLEEKMARMQRNLDILNTKKLSLISGESADDKRRQLLDRIDAAGCNNQPILASAEPVPAESMASDLPGGYEQIRVPESNLPSYENSRFVDLGGASQNGSLRTMCVRTCDGGYFPISSNASSQSFRRDAQVCSMMCPGVETELFYHSINQESADMRSTVTGRRYDALPNAYKFRTEKANERSQCGCNFTLYYQEMMKRDAYISKGEKPEIKQSAITWIKPELRGQIKENLGSKVSTNEAREYKADPRIRRIGPAFLPDEHPIDVMANAIADDTKNPAN